MDSRPHIQRKDTFDLREDLHPDDGLHLQAHADATAMHYGIDEEEHSVLEDDSEQDEGEDVYEEDDMSSTLSIPNESIDFDMVYALHSFAATVEGQANVVKGDSLFLMDDSNSYWWLVRVLKTQEVGYIPAENIETPFERLARLNKHRNIDLALPTQQEQQESYLIAQERLQNNFSTHVNQSNVSLPGTNRRNSTRRNVHFNTVRTHHRYVPALRDGEIENDDDEWDTDGFEDEDLDLAPGQLYMDSMDEDDLIGIEIDDGMVWDDGIIEDIQPGPVPGGIHIPDVLQPGSLREQQQQQLLRAQQQQQQELFSQQQQQHHQQQQQFLQQQRRDVEFAQQQAEAEMQQQHQRQQQEPTVSGSREILIQDASAPQTQGLRRIDPAEITETRKVTATPTIAREIDERLGGRPTFPSVIVEDERKRSREDDSSDESINKKKAKGRDKMPPPVSSATYNRAPQPAKLRKERSSGSNGDSTDEELSNPKKKKNSMFGGLFGRKKEKMKDKQTTSVGSIESIESFTREEPDRARNEGGVSDGTVSPTTVTAQQQQHAINVSRDQIEQVVPSTPDRSGTTQVSAHAHVLRQKDQQQQALYLQYLNRSPSSPPEAQPSYGLQSASAVMLSSPSNSALGPPQPRPRPGSLILSPSAPGDSQANLNVIRVFAGKHLQTEATFKTVLLNASTTSADLVRQALQRFRLPASEQDGEYYLTVKQVEGGAFAALESDEKPLVVFETLVSETLELPKLNRNSVGSISSISSNLSMHPAIKKLHMNDFTDDSSVKFYLNRKRKDRDDASSGHGDDDTIKVDSSFTSDSDASSTPKSPQNSSSSSVDRFTSTSIRFPLQVVIYAEDLPDDMQFHPTTEAIVYKSSLPEPISPVLVSPTLRRKIFMMPKNVTVAEVTELGLERFGIQDGVVDGGDEVEDKMTKRRSGARIRYGLTISVDGHEREIYPSSKVVDACPRPPQYRNTNPTGANKRRSLDPSLLYGSVDDIRPDDPVFVIRRATSYRNSRRRSSVPLDELALSKLHRESASSYSSSDIQSAMDDKMKRHELIAAQRAAIRATQRAIISAQTNSVRGMDVLLPGNAMLRSSRFDTNERMRYSYVEPDGETYDISDIIEEEWRDIDNDKDLLEGVFIRNKDGIGDRLDRFINKIRKGKQREKDYPSSGLDVRSSQAISSIRSISPSEYSVNTETSRSLTPGSQRIPNGVDLNPDGKPTSRPDTATPTASLRSHLVNHNRRHPSITSVISDYSGRSTPPVGLTPVDEEKPTAPHRIIYPKDDFGLSQMMSIIEFKATKTKANETPSPHPVEELLFGVPIDIESLHPDIREIYAPAFKHLEEIDKVLDGYFPRSLVGAI